MEPPEYLESHSLQRIQMISRHLCSGNSGAVLSSHTWSGPGNSNFLGRLKFSPEVERARREGLPIVALESTIISHGMPYPQNYETAREVESIVRKHGAVPATICVLKGVPHIGLTEGELLYISKNKIKKLARRDLAHAMALRMDGATTVSSTMFLCSRASIPVFVTGGIGGVHRGAETTMDISSDLTELGRTPVTVVCAGVKSILDIPKTLEYLETQGVCVAAYQTDEFPAFFTRKSGVKAPCRFDDPTEVAKAIQAGRDLGLGSGMVLGVPIPEKHSSLLGMDIERVIENEIRDIETRENITGSQITPYLLDRVRIQTKGKSLLANIALIKHNAKLGAEIALLI
eukprot:jgi/Picsp_1/1949/NSC_05415-R1_protein